MKEHQGSGPLDMVTHAFSRIMMWAPFFVVLIILYEVVMRYFFAAATLWVNEMSLWIAGGIYLSAGLYAYWNGMRDVRVETVDARTARFEHDDLKVIVC